MRSVPSYSADRATVECIKLVQLSVHAMPSIRPYDTIASCCQHGVSSTRVTCACVPVVFDFAVDKAFDTSKVSVSALSAPDSRRVLQYHTLPTAVPAGQLGSGSKATLLSGHDVKVEAKTRCVESGPFHTWWTGVEWVGVEWSESIQWTASAVEQTCMPAAACVWLAHPRP